MKEKKNSFKEIFSRNKKAYISVFVCLFVVYALLIVGIGSSNKDKGSELDNINNENVADNGTEGSTGAAKDPAPTAVPQISGMPDITNVPPTKIPDSQSAGSNDVSVLDGSEQDKSESVENPADKPTANKVDFNPDEGIAKPLDGEIIMPYSIDHGIYHETLSQFMTNDGLLIDSKNGEVAKACTDAVVSDIYTDTRRGLCVELKAGEYTFVYGQLSSSSVNKGDKISEGTAVGMVGEPTKYYSVEGAHLYFKVMNGEETVDPEEMFRE